MTSALLLMTAAIGAPARVECAADTRDLTTVVLGVVVRVSSAGFAAALPADVDDDAAANDAAGAQAWIVVGETAAGESFRLSFGETWVLRSAAGEKTLTVPKIARQPGRVRLLGTTPKYVWFAAPDLLGRIDVETGEVNATRLRRRGLTPLPIQIGDEAVVALGAEVLRCEAPGRCSLDARLPGAVDSVVAGPSGWLYAVSGRERGLYRAPHGSPAEATMLLGGHVRALCDQGEGEAWALLTRGDATRFVAVSTETPAIRPFTPAEALTRAVLDGRADAGAVRHVLKLAAEERWPALEDLALKSLNADDPTVRRAAAESLPGLRGARGIAALWLLGHDDDPDVRFEALLAGVARCRADATVECRHVLGPFITDRDPEIGWTARDILLDFDPQNALRGAPSSYKLEAIAGLVSLLQRGRIGKARRALELLVADTDPEVRNAANVALVGTLP